MQALGDEARSSGMGCDRVVADGAGLLVVAFKVKGVAAFLKAVAQRVETDWIGMSEGLVKPKNGQA
jgi:hypothetical protein